MPEDKLFDAEYKFMTVLWEYEPVNSTVLCRLCQERLGWKKSTTYSMIKKLALRGVLENREARVTSLLKKETAQRRESAAVLEKAFGNSLPAFVAAFLKDNKLSSAERAELEQLIREAEGGCLNGLTGFFFPLPCPICY